MPEYASIFTHPHLYHHGYNKGMPTSVRGNGSYLHRNRYNHPPYHKTGIYFHRCSFEITNKTNPFDEWEFMVKLALLSNIAGKREPLISMTRSKASVLKTATQLKYEVCNDSNWLWCSTTIKPNGPKLLCKLKLLVSNRRFILLGFQLMIYPLMTKKVIIRTGYCRHVLITLTNDTYNTAQQACTKRTRSLDIYPQTSCLSLPSFYCCCLQCRPQFCQLHRTCLARAQSPLVLALQVVCYT